MMSATMRSLAGGALAACLLLLAGQVSAANNDRMQNIALIAVAAERMDIPVAFALGIGLAESSANHCVESDAGALGLMQVLPSGAGTDHGVTAREHLLDPWVSASVGTRHLNYLLRKYGGSFAVASAAYNAGEGRVDRWLATHGAPENNHQSVENWIRQIPFEETRAYVPRVLTFTQTLSACQGGSLADCAARHLPASGTRCGKGG